MTDAQLHLLCLRWAMWSRSRRWFAPPPMVRSILGRMQPGKVRPPFNAELSPEMSFLNLAITAQPDSPAKTSFLVFYVFPARSVKEAAAAQGVSRDAFYRRVRRFRRRAWHAARALMQAEARQRQGEREPRAVRTLDYAVASEGNGTRTNGPYV